jgi:hypothetical protein
MTIATHGATITDTLANASPLSEPPARRGGIKRRARKKRKAVRIDAQNGISTRSSSITSIRLSRRRPTA